TMFNIFNKFNIEVWGRLVTIFSSLGSLIFLYLLTKKYLGVRIGSLTAFFFAFLPYNIYYSRTILPDPSMVMAILAGIYFFDRWVDEISNLKSQISNINLKTQIFYGLAILFTASAFLIKPFALFFTLPMIYLAFRKWGIKSLINPQLWLFMILTLAPLIFWRNWIQQFPEGIPASSWLFNEGNIRFKGAFFYWIFADRIGRLILGYWGIALLILGLARKIEKKEGLFFWSFIISSLLYLVVMAGGNVKHDYYQILIVPTLAVFLAKGVDFLLVAPKEYLSKTICYLLFAICYLFMFGFSWYFIRDYFNINNSAIVSAGKIVDQLTPKDAKVIAPYGGDTAFLYQTNRQGWPVFDRPIEKFKESGANYLIIANPTKSDFEGFGKMLSIVASSKDYLLLAL
ncbi:glycosyltransferase family 39 protein, partial [Candidatus Daviesbacteria bacterium]|nr:glycosyltransferase family 39 protein [Candidatus Daviesbacteria bacterium]